MRRVLLIAFDYPPAAGGGVIRIAKLTKYLAEFDWLPIVLTVRAGVHPVRDSGLLDEVDSVGRTYRAPARHIPTAYERIGRFVSRNLRLTRRRQGMNVLKAQGNTWSAKATLGSTRLSNWVLVPDDRVGWVPGAVNLGRKVISRERIDALFSTSPYPSNHLVGYCLHRLCHRPWIAEFRDPWMQNPFSNPRPIPLMEGLEAWMERRVVLEADHVVVTSVEYQDDFLRQYPALSPSAISFIPNGFDPEDFLNVKPLEFEKFTILHAGSFYGKRSPGPFLQGLEMFVERQPEARARIQVLFLGGDHPVIEQWVKGLALEDVVRMTGQVGHGESIRHMVSADLLLLIPGPGKGTMPGKTFEYLAAQKPVLAIADEGVTRDFICSTGIGVVVDTDDVPGIAGALARMYADIVSNRYQYPDVSSICARYDRRGIAERVAGVLDKVTGQV